MIGLDTTFLVQLSLQELPGNRLATELLQRRVQARERLILTPQVLNEFLHIATDARRFVKPLTMTAALERVEGWWTSPEVDRVYPTTASTDLFLHWMRQHRLGRKRLLDTQLAATLWAAGVRRIISSNAADFRLLGFEVVTP